MKLWSKQQGSLCGWANLYYIITQLVEIATLKKVVAQAKEDTPKDTVDF